MKKQLIFAWLLFITPAFFSSHTLQSTAVEQVEESFDDFNFDELELTLDQADLAGQELVKPPSPWIVWLRRIFSPIGVAIIKLCDTIRESWNNTVGSA